MHARTHAHTSGGQIQRKQSHYYICELTDCYCSAPVPSPVVFSVQENGGDGWLLVWKFSMFLIHYLRLPFVILLVLKSLANRGAEAVSHDQLHPTNNEQRRAKVNNLCSLCSQAVQAFRTVLTMRGLEHSDPTEHH